MRGIRPAISLHARTWICATAGRRQRLIRKLTRPELRGLSRRGGAWHRPWHTDRVLSHLFRGGVDVDEANRVLAEAGHDDLRFLDNGAISTPVPGIDVPHAYHLVPGGASKAKGVAFHMQARGYAPEDCIAIGDSVEDLDCAAAVGRFFVVANGPARDPAMGEALARFPNAAVTDASMGDGFYEAVVSVLMERG